MQHGYHAWSEEAEVPPPPPPDELDHKKNPNLKY